MPPSFVHRITKYDPADRDERGHYSEAGSRTRLGGRRAGTARRFHVEQPRWMFEEPEPEPDPGTGAA